MSGTSLDGLDLALCQFKLKNGKWVFSIEEASTVEYSAMWISNLAEASTLPSDKLISLDRKYGIFIGETINTFLTSVNKKPDFIVSHGHTIFHQPNEAYNFQLGNGNDIFSITSIPIISDLRSLDVSMGGQGAPLVPLGDKLLFSEFDACINLGGFSNISYDKLGHRIAFDIVPVNIILNEISKLLGHPFDRDGELAKSGIIIPELLNELNLLEYYSQPGPKSLGKEWLYTNFIPILAKFNDSKKDILKTLYEHIVFQILRIINLEKFNKILITGGGCHNKFLISLLQKHCHAILVIPEEEIIDFKEALIFAFLGILRIRGENNCLSSVTGASRDCSGGTTIGF